jgi:hypothetical protein
MYVLWVWVWVLSCLGRVPLNNQQTKKGVMRSSANSLSAGSAITSSPPDTFTRARVNFTLIS